MKGAEEPVNGGGRGGLAARLPAGADERGRGEGPERAGRKGGRGRREGREGRAEAGGKKHAPVRWYADRGQEEVGRGIRGGSRPSRRARGVPEQGRPVRKG